MSQQQASRPLRCFEGRMATFRIDFQLRCKHAVLCGKKMKSRFLQQQASRRHRQYMKKDLPYFTQGQEILKQRSVQPLKSAVITIPLKSVQIQRIGRSHQLLTIDHAVVEIPLLKRVAAARGESGRVEIAASYACSGRVTVTVTAGPGAGVIDSSRSHCAGGCQLAQVVLEEFELFFIKGRHAVAAGDHFREDGVGDAAEFVDVAEKGWIDSVCY